MCGPSFEHGHEVGLLYILTVSARLHSDNQVTPTA